MIACRSSSVHCGERRRLQDFWRRDKIITTAILQLANTTKDQVPCAAMHHIGCGLTPGKKSCIDAIWVNSSLMGQSGCAPVTSGTLIKEAPAMRCIYVIVVGVGDTCAKST